MAGMVALAAWMFVCVSVPGAQCDSPAMRCRLHDSFAEVAGTVVPELPVWLVHPVKAMMERLMVSSRKERHVMFIGPVDAWCL
jgi:hypothetical protein